MNKIHLDNLLPCICFSISRVSLQSRLSSLIVVLTSSARPIKLIAAFISDCCSIGFRSVTPDCWVSNIAHLCRPRPGSLGLSRRNILDMLPQCGVPRVSVSPDQLQSPLGVQGLKDAHLCHMSPDSLGLSRRKISACCRGFQLPPGHNRSHGPVKPGLGPDVSVLSPLLTSGLSSSPSH